jgi:hypothetical protein
MEFNWTINKVQVAENNLVIKVDLTVTNGEFSASYTRNLTRSETFTAYEQLTEQQVLDWCFAPEVITWVDQDDVEQSTVRLLKDEGEAQIAGQIERHLEQQATEPALPWV